MELLRQELQEAYEALRARVEGLSDDEFFWEPVPGCWTVRRGADGRWAVDYPEPPHPDPAPFTTIGWRLVHVAECKVMYHEYAFGAAKLTFPEIDPRTPPRPRSNSSKPATPCSSVTLHVLTTPAWSARC